MDRFFSAFGYALATVGTAAGVWIIVSGHATYTENLARIRGGVPFFAPLVWQLTAAAGVGLILSSVVGGMMLVGVGSLHRRLARLERTLAALDTLPVATEAVSPTRTERQQAIA